MRRLPLLFALLLVAFSASAQELTAAQLIAKFEAGLRTSGFKTRARLVRTVPGSKGEEVMQVVIKGRREGEATKLLYQILWPRASQGQAVVVETAADGTVSGFLFGTDGKVTPLSPKLMSQTVFGTDITVEDVAEAYWRWPHQKIVGEETVSGRKCEIIESRPGPGTVTSYSLVKTWMAPDLAIPVVAEKFGKDGALLRRFFAAKIVKQGPASWGAAVLVVDSTGGRGRTVVEGTSSERDIEVPAEQFTPEGLRKNLPAPQAPATSP
jgi:hypothetical protein